MVFQGFVDGFVFLAARFVPAGTVTVGVIFAHRPRPRFVEITEDGSDAHIVRVAFVAVVE